MTHKIIKKTIVFLSILLSMLILFSVLSYAHSLSSWVSRYPATSANTTYSFGIMNRYHIDGKNVKYYYTNSSVKTNFNDAIVGSFSTSWKNLITGTEVSNAESAHVKLYYDPINQPANVAATTTCYIGDNHYGLGSDDIKIVFYKDSKDYSVNSKRILAAHEFGHLWGIDDLYNYNNNLDSIYSHSYDFTYATRHDRNAMRICLNNLWFNPGGNQVWQYQSSPGVFIKRADVNQDGCITSADARLILQFCSQTLTPTILQFKLADVDGNGIVTSADAQEVLRYAANLESKFPADIDED